MVAIGGGVSADSTAFVAKAGTDSVNGEILVSCSANSCLSRLALRSEEVIFLAMTSSARF